MYIIEETRVVFRNSHRVDLHNIEITIIKAFQMFDDLHLFNAEFCNSENFQMILRLSFILDE
jgi:hypothetical protein